MTTKVTKDVEGNRLIIERSYPVPAELIWDCWTQADHLRGWWGPKGWLVDIFELDVRSGGLWRYRLRPEAEHDLEEEQWGSATYRVVHPPNRLEFDDAFADASGVIVEGSEMPTAVVIDTNQESTAVTITVAFTNAEQLEAAEPLGMIEGFTDALARLGDRLSRVQHFETLDQSSDEIERRKP